MTKTAAFVLVAILAVAGCSGQTTNQATGGPATTPAQNASPAPSQAAMPTTVPTPTATPTLIPAASASPAPTAFVCILQFPEQVGTDLTPLTYVYSGVDAAQCAQILAKDNAAGQNATMVSVMPTGSPVCAGTFSGVALAIYGTSAAETACAALKLK